MSKLDEPNEIDELFYSIKCSLHDWQEELYYKVAHQHLMDIKPIRELVDGKIDVVMIPVVETVRLFDDVEPRVLEVRLRSKDE